MSATLKIGTLGPGIDLAASLNPTVGVRAGFNRLAINHAMKIDNADVDGRLRWQTIPVLLDWFPTGTGFRVSAGVVFNANRIIFSAVPGEKLELASSEYFVKSLDGRIRFGRETAPYLGIGYGNPGWRDSRWQIACDLGIIFQGSPSVTAEAEATYPAMQPFLDRDLQHEIDKLEDDLSSFRVYPVLSIGLSYRF